uniref:Uncharacterized protein n=1 Tax=Ralstonia solanacearum TaxID=305 RepID=A0A0S4VCM7_RALSL|nr:protein of unknown function [Ralstonia solanacearum]CUV31697.1 protein of unknown function [Ralstonia solanacearum]
MQSQHTSLYIAREILIRNLNGSEDVVSQKQNRLYVGRFVSKIVRTINYSINDTYADVIWFVAFIKSINDNHGLPSQFG